MAPRPPAATGGRGGTGPLLAGAGGKGRGLVKPAPGRDGPSEAGVRKGRGALKLSPEKGRAVSSTALAGCGRGRDGRGCGEQRNRHGSVPGPRPTGVDGRFPNGQGSAAFLIRVYGGYRTPHIPTRPAWFEMVAIRPFRTTEIPDRSDSLPLATDPSPVGHGSVTGVRPRHGDAGKSSLPPVLSNSHGRAAWIGPPIGALKHAARYRPLIPAHFKASEGVRMWRSRHLRQRPGPNEESLRHDRHGSPTSHRPCAASLTEVRHRIVRVTPLPQRLTSRAPHGGHSLPGPP